MRFPLILVVGVLAGLLLASAAEGAKTQTARATDEVQRWESPERFETPYAFVDVKHDGKALERTAISRCRGTYLDADIAVRISTCGRRWRVRAAYVSLTGHDERFSIVYGARESD